MQTLAQLQSGDLKGVTSLKISENLSHFPQEIFELANTLEYLDLSSNLLSCLPDNFGKLVNLKVFFCSNNLFTVLPEVLGDCPLLDIVGFKSNQIETVPSKSLNLNLRWLILTNNRLLSLPAGIGKCERMQKLMLAGNRLTELPEELRFCEQLSLLRISANQLKDLPLWLLSMKRLAWIAFSSNDFNRNPVIKHIPQINLAELYLSEQLGEGASGIIYKAKRIADQVNFAVKIFKGEVTSDGYPADEMNAYIQAGSHYGLVNLLGEIDEPIMQKKGLVMDLIAPHFYNLGRPPSLETCTRDIFNEDILLLPKQTYKIAFTIASVGEQLQSRGIIHGDLYAHNILVDNEGNALFGDFGAASLYDINNEHQSFCLERIEIRAYGYLLDDLLSVSKVDGETSFYEKFTELRDDCLSLDFKERPSFSMVIERLSDLSIEFNS